MTPSNAIRMVVLGGRSTAWNTRGDHDMPTYLIERTIPGAGQMDADTLAAIAGKSNDVLRDLGPSVQWLHSYVTDDGITCIYEAANEAIIREHGRCGGFPVDAVHEVRTIISPATATAEVRS
jgi:hypothetical protein